MLTVVKLVVISGVAASIRGLGAIALVAVGHISLHVITLESTVVLVSVR